MMYVIPISALSESDTVHCYSCDFNFVLVSALVEPEYAIQSMNYIDTVQFLQSEGWKQPEDTV